MRYTGEEIDMEAKKAQETELKTLAEKIAAEPSQWALILGDKLSYNKSGDYKKILSQFANRVRVSCKEKPDMMQQIYELIQNEEYVKLQGALFGDIWNATSFKDELKEEQIQWRKEYAQCMASRERINIDCAEVDLRHILSAFSGLILTTCQDETVEAFMEYERSVPVTDMVCTPYILTTAQEWYKRIQTKSGEFRHFFPKEDANGNMHALIKLYGSCTDSQRMLLSEQDFQEYYPAEPSKGPTASEPKTVSFLREIFHKKNLLLLGMNPMQDGQLFAEGITKLLEDTGSDDKERYLVAESKGLNAKYLNGCHITLLKCRNTVSRIREFGNELQSAVKKGESGEEYSGQGYDAADKVLNQEEAMEQFWKYYIRRSYKNFYSKEELVDGENYAEREAELLETKILGYGADGAQTKRWTDKSIKQLAIAANNLADFYDLDKCLRMAEDELRNDRSAELDRDSAEFCERITQKLLVDRLSSRSLLLHQILSFYGGGFPLGFLLLLSDQETDLKEWKRAGIQLTNSGIYIKRQHRKNLHERMSYADSIMEEAGENPYKKEFQEKIKSISSVPSDSYFYPLDNKIEGKESQERINELFEGMLCKLHDILSSKSSGYRQMRSLLQTEMPSLVSKIGELSGSNFRWKPALVYYLVCESRVAPTDRAVSAQLDNTLSDFLQSPFLQLKEGGDRESNQEVLSGRIMILLAKIAVECQSFSKEKQIGARDDCVRLEKLIEEHEGESGTVVRLSDTLFQQKMQVYLMESRISGRLSTIAEIERCQKRQGDCPEQREALSAMYNYLEEVKKQIEQRESVWGPCYKGLKAEWHHLMGEYFFKQSQFYRENITYGGKKQKMKESDMYENSKNYYQEALGHYNKYPDLYWIQRADVMRNLADLYCQEAKSTGAHSLKSESYKLLMDAYMLYRSNLDLHGVADVLQSMGNLEDFDKKELNPNSMSPLCFYQAAKNLYAYLGDEWSWNVVSAFEEGISVDRNEGKRIYSIK